MSICFDSLALPACVGKLTSCLQELLGAEKGKSSAVRDIASRGKIYLVLRLDMTPRQHLLLHFIQACSDSDSKSLRLQPKQGYRSDSIQIVACNALFSYQTQVKTSLLTSMPSPQELTGGSAVPKTRSHRKHGEKKKHHHSKL